MFTTRFQRWVRQNALRLGAALGRLGVTPNQITVAGTLVTFVAAALAGLGYLVPAGLVLAFSGTFDILDGAVARATGNAYPYGAFLDSTMDRYSEAAIYLGVAAYFISSTQGRFWMEIQVLGCFAALAGSLLVSYARARAQSLGFACDVGLFARPERVVVTVAALVLTSVFGPAILTWAVFLLAVLTNFTAVQRIHEVWLQGRAQHAERERERETGSRMVAPTREPGRP